jgi:hypothetical protein
MMRHNEEPAPKAWVTKLELPVLLSTAPYSLGNRINFSLFPRAAIPVPQSRPNP